MRPLFLALALVLAAIPARAQYLNPGGGTFPNMAAFAADQTLSRMMFTSRHQIQRLVMDAHAKKQLGPSERPASLPAYKFPMTATDIRPSGIRNVPERLAASLPNPKDRGPFIQMCRELRKGIEAEPSVRKNNLAMALTLLLGSSIQVVANRELSEAESEDLMRTVNDTLAGEEGYRSMSAERRTLAYDTCLITGGLIAALAHNGKEGDPAQSALAKELAAQTLQTFGLNAK
ncbi:MAG TPA: DUF6683 family protein [Geothrix sp.]|jgi:hypothetical protein